jgi:predicted nucleotidyltransferase
MTPDRIEARITDLAERLGQLSYATEWYLFGSALEKKDPQDIDLLIVYDQEVTAQALLLREALDDLPQWPPLDLVVLSRKEEAEVSFIAKERARLVWK